MLRWSVCLAGIGLINSFLIGCASSQSQGTRVLQVLPDPIVNTAAASPRPVQVADVRGLNRYADPPQRLRHNDHLHTAADGFPRQWYPPHKSHRWTDIVVHHSATIQGSASFFDQAHRNRGWDELGYHFVIGNGNGSADGLVEVGSRWYKQKHGAHCKTPSQHYNQHGIGICLVGDFTNHRPSPEQMASLHKLLAFLMEEFDIPANRIYGHGELGSTQCPGAMFDMNSLRADMSVLAGSQ